MIEVRLQVFFVLIVVISCGYMINMIRKGQLELQYALLWLFVGFLMVLAILFPKVLVIISSLMGFEKPVSMLFLFAIFLQFFLTFSLTISHSKNVQKNKVLIQEISILKSKIESEEE